MEDAGTTLVADRLVIPSDEMIKSLNYDICSNNGQKKTGKRLYVYISLCT